MKTILIFLITFFVNVQNLHSQCMGCPQALSGYWQSVDPPTFRWQAVCGPCNGCTGVFFCINRGINCPPFYPMNCNWYENIFSLTDSCWTLPNSLWSQFIIDTTYHWLSKIQNSIGNQWCICVGPVIRLNATLPLAILISPPNNSSSTSLTPLIKWNPVNGATSYRVRIYSTQGLSIIAYDSLLVRDSLYVPPGKLVNNHMYWWSVKSYQTGGEGPFADLFTFATEPTGIKQLSSDVPKSFSLFQNYPNPFNPSTKINFSIPQLESPLYERGIGGFITLKIYDVPGHEVATLVNEKLQPGTYEVEFNGSNYPSGVYFYTLKTESFNQTKRMVLIK